MKCYHGRILTVDRQDTVCQYLVEDGGRIVATGTPEVVRNCGDSITGKYI